MRLTNLSLLAFLFLWGCGETSQAEKVKYTPLENLSVQLVRRLHEHFQSYYFDPTTMGDSIKCSDDLLIEPSTEMSGDTSFIIVRFVCLDKEIWPSSPYINTIVFVNERFIGYNVGRSFSFPKQDFLDSISPPQ